jgi:hypothetical protein
MGIFLRIVAASQLRRIAGTVYNLTVYNLKRCQADTHEFDFISNPHLVCA